MPVPVQCPTCGQRFKIKDEFAGKMGRCTQCKATFRLTALANETSDAIKPVAAAAIPANAVTTAGTAPLASVVPERAASGFGRFQVRTKLGAGAFGAVYRAFDPHLEREVALKVPQPGVLDSPKRVDRFLREAKAAAQLRHPNIVPVYDAGSDSGKYYIASAFIDGKALADAIDDKGVEFSKAAQIVADLADALFYAHMLGVVHRDVKPANIMLDDNDKPHLMDFGLAAWENSTEKLTHDGAVLGTPTYMAPEQAQGQQGEAKAESDQYSLGVVLYEMLTGKTPFEGPPQVVMYNVVHTEPPKPASIRKGIPRDLETICLKAMAKRPQDRYTSCQAFARDLRRWMEGEPIQARRLGIVERAGRWAKREPMLASAATVIVLLLSALAGVLTWRNGQLGEFLGSERHARLTVAAKLEKSLADLEQEKDAHGLTQSDNYLKRIGLNESLLDRRDYSAALDGLNAMSPERRGWEWKHQLLASEGRSAAVKSLTNNPGPIAGLAFSLDSQNVICLCQGKMVKIWDIYTGRSRVVQLQGDLPHWGAQYALSGDGQKLVSAFHPQGLQGGGSGNGVSMPVPSPSPASNDGKGPVAEVVVWDASTGRRLKRIHVELKPGPIVLALNGDGSKLALAAGDDQPGLQVRIFDTATGEMLYVFPDRFEHLTGVVFDPSGERVLMIAGGMRTTYKTECYPVAVTKPDGEVVTEMRTKTEPYSQKLPVSVKLWEAVGGKDTRTIQAEVGGLEPAFSNDGKLLALFGSGGGMQMVTKKVMETFTVKIPITVTKKGPDGKLVAVTQYRDEQKIRERDVTEMISRGDSNDPTPGSVMLFDVETGLLKRTLDACVNPLAVAFNPDGTRLATFLTDGCFGRAAVRLWDPSNGALVAVLSLPDGLPSYVASFFDRLAWSPDGLHLAAASSRHPHVIVWSAHTGRLVTHFAGQAAPVNTVSWSPDGSRIATYSDCTRTGLVWDVGTGVKRFGVTLMPDCFSPPTQSCLGFAYSGDGQRLIHAPVPAGAACYGMGGYAMPPSPMTLWQAADGTPIELKNSAKVFAESSDGKLRAVMGPMAMPSPLAVEDASGKTLWKLPSSNGMTSNIMFSGDGRWLAYTTSSHDPKTGKRSVEARVHDARAGKLMLTQPRASGLMTFRPGTNIFASMSMESFGGPVVAQPPVPFQGDESPPPLPAPQPKNNATPKTVEKVMLPSPFNPLALLFLAQPPLEPIPVPKGPKGDGPKGVIKSPPPPEVQFFDLATAKEIHTLTGFAMPPERLVFSPDGKFFVTTANNFIVWDAATFKEIHREETAVEQFLFSRDGKRLYFVTTHETVNQKGPGFGVPMPAVMPAPASAMLDPMPATVAINYLDDDETPLLAFGPRYGAHGRMDMAAPRQASKIAIWDLVQRREERALIDLSGSITALAVSPDGNNVACATHERPTCELGGSARESISVHVWTVANGKKIAEFEAHGKEVTCLAFSPDSQRLASASLDGAARVWSLVLPPIAARSAQEPQPVLTATLGDQRLRHWGQVDALVFHPNGRTLFSAGQDRLVIAWDVETGREIRRLVGHTQHVRGLSLPAHSPWLASSSWDNLVKLWIPETGEELRTLPPLQPPPRRPNDPPGRPFPGPAVSVAVSPDGAQVAAGNEWGRFITLWDTESGKVVRTFDGHTGSVWSVAFRPDGKLLASGAEDGKVKLWNVSDGKEAKVTAGHKGAVRVVTFTPDGKALVSSSSDQMVKVWNPETGEEIKSWNAGHGDVWSLTIDAGGQRLATAGQNGEIHLWDLDGKRLTAIQSGHRTDILALAFSPDGKKLASSDRFGFIKLWSLETNKELIPTAGHEGIVTAVGVTSDGKTIASASHDGTLRFWDHRTGQLRATHDLKANFTDLEFRPDNKELALSAYDNLVRIWDVAAKLERKSLKHKHHVYDLAYHPEGQLLVAGDHAAEVILWDIERGEAKFTLKSHKAPVRAVAFARDGLSFASGSEDGVVTVWNTVSGTEKFSFNVKEPVSSLVFAEQDQSLAVGTNHGAIRVWGLSGPFEKSVLRGHEGPIRGLTANADGSLLSSVAQDGAVRFWQSSTGLEWDAVRLTPVGISYRAAFGDGDRALTVANGNGTISVVRFLGK